MKGGYVLIDLTEYIIRQEDGDFSLKASNEGMTKLSYVYECLNLGKPIIVKIKYMLTGATDPYTFCCMCGAGSTVGAVKGVVGLSSDKVGNIYRVSLYNIKPSNVTISVNLVNIG